MDELPTIEHALKTKRRRCDRTVQSVKDGHGAIQTIPRVIAHTFTTFMCEKYTAIAVDTMVNSTIKGSVKQSLNTTYEGTLSKPFEYVEIYNAIKVGVNRRVPEIDGLGQEFYLHHWPMIREELRDIVNQMFSDGKVTAPPTEG